MLKTTRSLDKPTSSRNNSSKPASSRNDGSRLASKRNNGNGEIRFDGDSVEHVKKSRKLKDQKLSKLGKLKSKKLFKSRKSKSKKTSQSQNLAKSRKKLSKIGNSSNFDTTEARPKFLTLNAKTTFDHLRLAFTKALILQHFDPKCHIRIETNILGYAISKVLSKLTSETSLDEIVTKTNLDQ